MSRFRSRGVRALFAAAIVVLLAVAGAAPASAHPLGNFTVNRAIRVDIGSGVTATAVLDLAEIPAFEVIREVDTDGDELLSPAEGDPYAETTCATWADDLAVSVDGRVAGTAPTYDDGGDQAVLVLGDPRRWEDDSEVRLWQVTNAGLLAVDRC